MLSPTKIKNRLTTEDVIKLCCDLQEDDNYFYDSQGHPIFCTSICHGGDSWKLYYYPETQLFHCYTCGNSYDIFELVARAHHCEFREAYEYIVHFFGLKTRFNDDKEEDLDLIDDWGIFQQLKDFSKKDKNLPKKKIVNANMLEYCYPLAAPEEWLIEGISAEVMRYYNIRIDAALQKIIIPHFDEKGELLGIRARSYNPIELMEGKKYAPIWIENELYNYPTSQTLYGLFQNKACIERTRKVVIFEGEKSVMKAATYYGVDDCFCVATCGSSLSQEQIGLILNLGVSEVILAYDREYHGGRGEAETIEYEQKLLKILQPFAPYLDTYVVMDYGNRLGYKDSPIDQGKEVFEELMSEKIYISPIEMEGRGLKYGK